MKSFSKIVLMLALCIIILVGFFAYKPFYESYSGNTIIKNVLSIVDSNVSSESSAQATSSSFIAVGDIMLGRHVETLMDMNGDDYPFANIQNFLNSADTVVANLEGPIVSNHIETPSGSLSFTFDPRMASVLKNHNVGIVNLANNHTYDQGVSGFNQTTSYLDAAGVAHAGNPFVISDTYTLHTTIGSQKYIFVGFNITNPSFDFATANALVQNIAKNKSADEFLIAMCHGGDEYSLHSDTRQEIFYRGLIDDGVDAVIAHHPHVVEEIEVYKNKPIFYSLGNFIFDQYFSTDVQQELALKVTNTPTQTEYDLIPVQSIGSQPALMNADDSKIFLEALATRSNVALQNDIEAGKIIIKK